MTSFRFRASGLLKERILARYRIPFSRSGLDGAVVSFLGADKPVTVVDVGELLQADALFLGPAARVS